MHEFLLFGQISSKDHQHVLQQLAGVTRMQPQPVTEIHLVFKARRPPLPANPSTVGGSQDVVAPDVQKNRSLLNGSLFFIQLVGELRKPLEEKNFDPSPVEEKGDLKMADDNIPVPEKSSACHWRLEFQDIPDAGKQATSMRLVSRTPFEGDDITQFMSNFGFEYVSRYLITGAKFYDQDVTLFVHKVLQLPSINAAKLSADMSKIPPLENLDSLDGSDSWVLQTSIEVFDGNNQELKERATRQLIAMKETLKQSVTLSPGDRLSLDTRVPTGPRR